MPDAVTPDLRRVVLIRNPAARRPPSDAALAGVLEALDRSGWSATVVDSPARGTATALARQAAAGGAEVVVACGGDGTLNEVLNGLVGSDTALALVPAGTANVWAAEVGIAHDPAGALGLLDAGRRIRVDTGIVQIGDAAPRRFLLMCSAGVDAGVVREVERHPTLKRRIGRAAFALPSLRALLNASPVDATVTVDGVERKISLFIVLAGNTRLYGSVTRLADAALIDDGTLDLVTFEAGPGGWLSQVVHRTRLAVRALRGGLHDAQIDGIEYARFSRAEIRPARSLPVQVDGEFVGEAGPDAPLRLSIEPRSLTVVVPAGINPIFARDAER
jgi:YegS/Rv2252/BmrU family lipid kinase